MKANVYSIITDKFIEALERGEVAWQQPWKTSNGSNFVSHTSGKAYSFLNCMLLMMQGGSCGEYLTAQQVFKEKGKIKRGAKAKFVVFFKKVNKTEQIKNDEGEIVEIGHDYFVLRYYHVFHVNETTLNAKYSVEYEPSDLQPCEVAENIINDYVKREGIAFHNTNETNDAFFSPSQDLVQVPAISQYEIVEEYYSTTFHELVHSTGIEKRCHRGLGKKIAARRSDDYSKEELIAEIGSAMCCNRIGLDNDKAFNNSVAYVQSWLKALRNDKRLIVWASIGAEKAVKYIFNDK